MAVSFINKKDFAHPTEIFFPIYGRHRIKNSKKISNNISTFIVTKKHPHTVTTKPVKFDKLIHLVNSFRFIINTWLNCMRVIYIIQFLIKLFDYKISI